MAGEAATDHGYNFLKTLGIILGPFLMTSSRQPVAGPGRRSGRSSALRIQPSGTHANVGEMISLVERALGYMKFELREA